MNNTENSWRIVLTGNPNCGKSSIFNLLTGLNQKISNHPGTTIEKKTGSFKLSDGRNCVVTDLPGTYSLYPKSEDEAVASEYLLNIKHSNTIDLVVFVADSSNLERNLLLFTQIADLGHPMLLVLNMADIAQSKGISIDAEKLSEETGVLICTTNALNNKGISKLKEIIAKPAFAFQRTYFSIPENVMPFVSNVQHMQKEFTPYRAFVCAWHPKSLTSLGFNPESLPIEIVKQKSKLTESDTLKRYESINQILSTVQKNSGIIKNITHKIDQVMLHPIYGYLLFLGILFLVFQSVFFLAEFPMNWIENGVVFANNFLTTLLPESIFTSILTEGVMAGLSGVLVFVPQIMILFFFLGIMEETGYMSRVSYITDKLMRQFGLNGKSVIPLISGMACAIPSIMAARNIENQRERLITILVTPLMSCSARLPVYNLLVSFLVEPNHTTGIFNTKGLLMMSMYLLGTIGALLFALLFKFILKKKEKSIFIMELPDYKLPRWKSVLLNTLSKGNDFLFSAGKVIVLVSIILWFMKSFGPSDRFEKIEAKYTSIKQTDSITAIINREKLEASYAGIMGKFLEPAIAPMGFDWKIGISLVTSFAAREVFVGTMATIYSVPNEDDSRKIRERMQNEIHPITGKKLYNIPVVLSLMVFYTFAMQCISTFAVVKKETGGLKWPVIQLLYMTFAAYLCSTFVYQILS